MLEKGVIRESMSPWSFPVVLEKKKDSNEKLRFCVDFRELNKLNSRPMWPLPRVEDAVNSFGNSTYLMSLDFNSGFWQTKVAEMNIQKCSFVTVDGQYAFMRMPFGHTLVVKETTDSNGLTVPVSLTSSEVPSDP